MKQDKAHRRDCSKLITQTVMAFLECLHLRHSSSSDMEEAKARNEEEKEALSVQASARSLNVMSNRITKQPVSSGKPGGVNNYDM